MRYLWMTLFLGLSAVAHADNQQTVASDNLFAQHYRAQNDRGLASIQAAPNTELMRGENKQADNVSMLERGFDLMGSAGFEAENVAPEQAQAHGQVIKADTVLLYASKARNATPVSKMAFIKEAAKKGKVLNEADVKDMAKYDYFATYWAKLPPPLLGVHVIKLRKQDPTDDKVIEEPGLNVVAVIRESPAALAGLQRGDTLLKVANNEVNKPEMLSQVVRGLQGQTVEVVYIQGGETKTTQITLGKR